MDVLRVLAVLVAALFVLGAPGLPTVLALRLRPLTALAVVTPVSAVLIAASAELGHLLSIPWTVLSPLVLGLVLGGLLWSAGIGRRRSRHTHRVGAPEPVAHDAAEDGDDTAADGADAATPDSQTVDAAHDTEGAASSTSTATAAATNTATATTTTGVPETALGRALGTRRGRAATILLGLAIGGGYILLRALDMMGGLFRVNQSYDNVFHLNAVRHILRLGDGSAWTVGGMTTLPGEETFYPALWHQTVSLVVQLSGQDIVLASNLVMLLLGTTVWPLALMALVRTGTNAGPAGWLAAGALAGVASAFPLSMMSWGVLLPYLYSLSMMPLVLMLIVHLVRLAPDGEQRLTGGQLGVLVPAVSGAVALAHPQGVFVALVMGVPMMVWAVLATATDLVRRRPRAGIRLALLVPLTALVIVVGHDIWHRFRPVEASAAVWGPNATTEEAIWQTLTLAPNATPIWLPLGVLVALCVLAVLIGSRSRWLVIAFLAAGALSVATRSLPVDDLRYELTGNWYSDNNRITVMLATAAVPLLAVGLDLLLRWAARLLPVLRGTAGAVLAVALCLAIIAVGYFSPSTEVSETYLEREWRSDNLLSDDERALLLMLPEVVPEDAVIATNAWNGSSLAYAISDREVLNTFMSFQAEDEVHLLNGHLDDAQRDPEVCDAAEDLGVDYALDFGPKEIHGRSATYTGLNEISETGAAEVVLQVGDAKLLRMLPCRGTDGSMNG
ncbi:hypothetical protein HMPREF3159_00565 [Brachybacterium sp. HMSC06H03]|uniref:DUF6541 family protein n=1 Tax=Brachybacterium sp. HMSC06H03 TaxID=1581127 RepID=UPI0008A5907F|nr:DUF6541 family protein [Brachybacterium sp. HMSC06H03]OFT65900.1 hypothetical protein HMPREF3159_00565 [Brachybacterium sp. HMSC06H03]